MGTNYYFRKRTLDIMRLESIVDELNVEFKSLIERYNDKYCAALAEMGLDSHHDFDNNTTFFLPSGRDDHGDIHVGKLSYGWKPLMQAGEHFHSIETLKQWYEKNKQNYIFVNEYDEEVPFNEYLAEINERNQDPDAKAHDYGRGADGFDWTHRIFL